MSNNFRVLYLYVVALITLMMIVGGIVSTVHNIASYFYPDSYVFFEEIEYDEYSFKDNYDDNDYTKEKKNEIRRQNYKNAKIKNIVVSIVVIIVGGAMYKYHWNIIEKERNA